MTSSAQHNRRQDRRRYTRFETRFDVDVLISGTKRARCQIRDYCREGVLVSALDDVALEVAPGDMVEIYRAETPITPAVRITLDIVRLSGNGFGAMFNASQPEINALLRTLDGNPLSQDDNTDTPSAPDATSWSQLVREITDSFAHNRLEVIFSDVLQRCIDSIQDRLHQTSTNQAYQETIRDIATLQNTQKNVSQSLTVPLIARITDNTSRSTPSAPSDVGISELSLVDMKLFEHWLEAAKVATRLEDLFKSQLQQVETSIAELFSHSVTSNLPAVPFAPRQFTDLLNEFCEHEDFGDFTRTEFFLSARDVLSRQLGTFYEQLAGQFSNSTPANGPIARLPESNQSDSKPPAASGLLNDPQTHARLDTNQEFESDRSDVSPETAHRLAELLSQSTGDPEFKVALHKELENLHLPEHLASRTEQRGELAGELLQSISDANSSTDSAAQTWIRSLQPSIAESIIQDPGFMQHKANPLRALIDELDHLGSLLPTTDRHDGEQRAALTVEALLNKKLKEPGAVPDKFADTATQVRQLTNRLSQRYQRNVERVVATSSGRYRLKQTQQKVSEELNRRYSGHKVPGIVQRLLENCWHALLTLDVLRQGERNIGTSEPWETLDALIQHLLGEPHRRLDPRLAPDELFSRLKSGLSDASFDPIERENVLTELHELVVGTGASSKDLQDFTPYDLTTQLPNNPSNEVSDAQWSSVLKDIDGLQMGDVVALHNQGQASQHIRLAWSSDDGEDFTLVDQRGVRALETNRQDFAHRILAGNVELIAADQRGFTKRIVDDLLQRLENSLGKHKEHDTLTGLLNRGSFKPLLDEALALPHVQDRPILVWIEIEKFKMISSSLGFEAGDFILVRTSRLLRQVFDETNQLAYLGSDQFAALISGSSADHVKLLADSFCAQLSEYPVTWKDTKLPIRAGVGVVDLADVVGDVPQLIGLAAKTVAKARRAGCNCAHQYVANDTEAKEPIDSIESLIFANRILDHGRLRLRAQKIAHVDNIEAPSHHYEILLGAQDENDNPVNIGRFIAAAEAHNLMGQVDRLVTTEAIEWFGTHPIAMTQLGGIAINLSGQTMSDRSFVGFVSELIAEHDIPPTFISFEVTETAAIGSLDDARDIIQALKNMGCRSALDDFGTGLSSYEYLRELPVDYLKIDGTFVKNIANNENDYAVVRSINEIGKFMGKQTIAEYAVNADVLDCLRTIGVDYAQGFGIHEPEYLDQLL